MVMFDMFTGDDRRTGTLFTGGGTLFIGRDGRTDSRASLAMVPERSLAERFLGGGLTAMPLHPDEVWAEFRAAFPSWGDGAPTFVRTDAPLAIPPVASPSQPQPATEHVVPGAEHIRRRPRRSPLRRQCALCGGPIFIVASGVVPCEGCIRLAAAAGPKAADSLIAAGRRQRFMRDGLGRESYDGARNGPGSPRGTLALVRGDRDEDPR
jgi:hypothetical protein